jgi:hypothetical protein
MQLTPAWVNSANTSQKGSPKFDATGSQKPLANSAATKSNAPLKDDEEGDESSAPWKHWLSPNRQNKKGLRLSSEALRNRGGGSA